MVLRIHMPLGPWTLTTVSARARNLGLLFTHSKQLAEALCATAEGTAPPS
jgi:hypothetical protein